MLLPATVAAQPAWLRDSLAVLHTPTEVRPLLAGTGDDATSSFRRGLILLRLHEFTGDWRDAVAAKEAFVAAHRGGLQVEGLYGLARAALQDPLLRPVERRVLGGESWGGRQRSVAALKRALSLHAGYGDAAALLGELALEEGAGGPLLREATAAADTALGLDAANGWLLQVRSRLALLDGDAGAALVLAERAAAAGGGEAALTLAMARFAGGDAVGGAAAWESGLGALDGAAGAAYLADLRPLLSPAELEAWEAGGAEEQAALLRAHVRRRAAAAGVAEPALLMEHYRRLEHARRHFRRDGERGAPPSGALLRVTHTAEETPFDDRGAIWLRHGAPDEILRTTNHLTHPNETWVYTRPDGRNELFHFALLPGAPDWRLLEDLFAAVAGVGPLRDAAAAEALGRIAAAYPRDPDLLDIVAVMEDRATADPRYGTLAGRLLALSNTLRALPGTRADDPAQAARIREATDAFRHTALALSSEERRGVMSALAGADHTPRFATPLVMFADLLTFRGPPGRTDVVAALAMAGGQLTVGTAAGSAAHTLAAGFGVHDSHAEAVTRMDTTLHLAVPRSLAADEFIRLHLELRAPPARDARARVVLRDAIDADRGGVVDATLEVPDYRSAPLMVSSIVLAEPDSGGAWRRGEVALALVPHGQFPEGRAFRLFYEVYGLVQGEAYRTELRVDPQARPGLLDRIRRLLGGRPAVRIAFEEVAAPGEDGVVRQLRRVEHGLAPGLYRLSVRVTTKAGVEARGERRLSVRPAG